MQDRIAHAVARIGEVGHRAKHIARFGENHFHGIIKAPAGQHIQPRAIGPDAPNARCFPFIVTPVFGVDLKSVTAIRKVEHPVGPHNRPVQTCRVGRKIPTLNNSFALVRHAVAISVGEFVQPWWRRHVKRSLIEHGARRKRQFIGKYGGLVVNPIAIGIFQHADDIVRIGRHLRGLHRLAGRFTQEQPAAIINRAKHRIVDQSWLDG